MRFGIFTSLTNTTWDDVLQLWRHTEATGWDAACVTDHFMPNTKERVGNVLECWATLAALAPVVPRMRIGTIVVGNTYRHPAVVAKMAATVDVISGGRLILGLGAAWQENEHAAYGIPFYTVGERLARLDARAPGGAWTAKTLALIARRPRIAAGRLAESLGRDKPSFKADVIKLKRLGLTQSFEVGYEITPRGRAFLSAARPRPKPPTKRKPQPKPPSTRKRR